AYLQRETLALRMINDEARYSAQHAGDLIRDADRALLELRARRAEANGRLDLEHATRFDRAGGVALIAPDGHVVTATPRANTVGWPRLMTRLASSGDTLAIGEPIAAKNGIPGF